jgi:hypothetical protein
MTRGFGVNPECRNGRQNCRVSGYFGYRGGTCNDAARESLWGVAAAGMLECSVTPTLFIASTAENTSPADRQPRWRRRRPRELAITGTGPGIVGWDLQVILRKLNGCWPVAVELLTRNALEYWELPWKLADSFVIFPALCGDFFAAGIVA